MPDDFVDVLLNAPDGEARAQAAEALARQGPEARHAATALVRATGDREESVRDWAVAALEDLGPPPEEDVQPLSALAANPDLNIAYWACTLLGRLRGEAAGAVDALAHCLANHRELAVRERAAWALGQIGRPAQSAVGTLQQAMQAGDARLSRLAAKAIEAITGKAQ